MTRVLVRVLFGVLVLATFAAFFVAQRIKRSQPVLEKVRFTRFISPNGDGIRDAARISYRQRRTDRVDVAIVSRGGDVVRTFVSDRSLCGPCTHRFRWNGRSDAGTVPPDGAYFLRVTLRRGGRAITSPRKLTVDTTPPRPLVRSVAPSAISPDGDGRAERAVVRFEGPSGGEPGGGAPSFVVYRVGLRQAVRVSSFAGRRGRSVARWNGRIAGRSAPAGNYLIAVRARDAAGNVGSGPAILPPKRSETRGHPGVRVRYLAASVPPGPVGARRRAEFRVDTDRRAYRWRFRRAGAASGLPLRRSKARLLRVRAPRRAGVYELELRSGHHRYLAPFAVRGRRRGRVLVVLPLIQWLATNGLDPDQDGWTDNLATGAGAPIGVALRSPSGPPSYRAAVEPLARLLDLEGFRYDLTTDLALARGRGPGLAGRGGVLFAGPEPYVPDQLALDLRRYVEAGGRVASIEPDSFHRDVSVATGRLSAPGARRAAGPFGEATVLRDVPPGPLAVLSDRIGFFAGSGGRVGGFSRIETSEELPDGSTLLAGAGRETERPALVVYRLAKGVVARMGADGFTAQAAASPSVRPIMRRLWKLLSR